MRAKAGKVVAFLQALIWAMALGLIVNQAQARVMTLQEYRDEAIKSHLGLEASKRTAEGAQMRSQEGPLVTRPQFFSLVQYSDDKRVTQAPSFMGVRTVVKSYSAGVQQQFSFGAQAKISYNVNQITFFGTSPQLMPLSSFYDTFPKLELTVPLWRNLLGRETRTQQSIVESGALALSYGEKYKYRNIVAQIELNYYRLAQAREVVRMQKETLERAKKIKEWSSRRFGLQLSDKADLLQAEAGLKVRELELRGAMQAEQTVARMFNTHRGMDSEAVVEELQPLDNKLLKSLVTPSRGELRDDTRSALEQQKVASALAQGSLERNKPNLEFYSSLSLNGRKREFSESRSDSFTNAHPYDIFGVRFTMPLDVITLGEIQSGYGKEKTATELNFQRKLFEQEREWKDLNQKWKDSKERFEFTHMIEDAQKKKLLYERDRHQRGRSTTFQVLLFEQDFSAAQLARIKSETEVLELYTQLKLFETSEL